MKKECFGDMTLKEYTEQEKQGGKVSKVCKFKRMDAITKKKKKITWPSFGLCVCIFISNCSIHTPIAT